MESSKVAQTKYYLYSRRRKITWGEPAKITFALMDRVCPHCGADARKDEGFDLDVAGRMARCECNWSF